MSQGSLGKYTISLQPEPTASLNIIQEHGEPSRESVAGGDLTAHWLILQLDINYVASYEFNIYIMLFTAGIPLFLHIEHIDKQSKTLAMAPSTEKQSPLRSNRAQWHNLAVKAYYVQLKLHREIWGGRDNYLSWNLARTERLLLWKESQDL